MLWSSAWCRLEGAVTVPADTRGWTPAGEVEVAAGRRRLTEFRSPPETSAPDLDLDLWSTSLGEPVPGSWGERPPEEDGDAAELERGVMQFVRAMTFLDEHLPACRDWLCARTRIAVPLRSVAEGSRSISFPDVPGVVAFDLASDVMVLESLVHETAHVNLYLDEIVGPLVPPGDNGRFRSPLRSDLRPLRGILMAYHALAFIAAMYRDALTATGAGVFQQQLSSSLALAHDAEATVAAEFGRLTTNGVRFLERTRGVMAYALG